MGVPTTVICSKHWPWSKASCHPFPKGSTALALLELETPASAIHRGDNTGWHSWGLSKIQHQAPSAPSFSHWGNRTVLHSNGLETMGQHSIQSLHRILGNQKWGIAEVPNSTTEASQSCSVIEKENPWSLGLLLKVRQSSIISIEYSQSVVLRG